MRAWPRFSHTVSDWQVTHHCESVAPKVRHRSVNTPGPRLTTFACGRSSCAPVPALRGCPSDGRPGSARVPRCPSRGRASMPARPGSDPHPPGLATCGPSAEREALCGPAGRGRSVGQAPSHPQPSDESGWAGRDARSRADPTGELREGGGPRPPAAVGRRQGAAQRPKGPRPCFSGWLCWAKAHTTTDTSPPTRADRLPGGKALPWLRWECRFAVFRRVNRTSMRAGYRSTLLRLRRCPCMW